MEFLSNPAVESATYAKSDTVNFAKGRCRGLKIDGSGDIVVVYANGVTDLFTVAAGELLPVEAIRVNATNTTVTGSIHALY